MYAPAWTPDKVPLKTHVIPIVSISDTGTIWRVVPLIIGLVVTFVIVAVIIPAASIPSALILASGLWLVVATPTPNEVFTAIALAQTGKYPFSARKAIRPLETLLNALLTSVNLA